MSAAFEDGEREELEERLSRSNAQLEESRRESARSRQDALHDPLTGLANLTLFSDRLTQALAQAKRREGHLAVMFIDLDKFKVINDTHGHAAGDAVLKLVAQRMSAVTRGDDTVCRRSGDEFLFLMTGARRLENAGGVADKLMQAVARSCEVGGVCLTVRCSIGISVYPHDGQTAQLLLEHADSAMYAAKREARGYLFYDQLPRP